MKVIGINGSARKDGNTSLLIKAVFAELEAEGIETDLVQLHGKALEPCKACFGCGGKRQCVVKTDYFNECFAKMVEADGIVLGSPVYSADVTAGMKAFLERAGVVVATNPGMLRHKVGASVAAVRRGGERRKGTMLAYLQGLSLGLAYVAPIGVQNLFVINAGLSQPRAAAYRTALIVIFFDVTLALAGFFGIGALIEHSELIRKGVLLAGSLVVMYMGLRLMLSREVAGPAINVNIPLMKTIGMACVVTWFNPQAIIDVSLLLGSFRVALPPEESGLFLWGVVCASCLWFLSLTTISSLFKNRFTPRLLRIINLVCGLVIFFYGVKLGWSFVELWQSTF